ncbi:MAG: hypothetical protein ACTS9Y_13375 [Methylophilus sp.]|uniref:hypothetical protein n=1 Tax=Methylophilus sp. TaxID=29541 RepID=UPI003F9F5B59
MTSLAIKPEVSLNTVIALLVAGGALYLAWKIKNGVSDVADDLGEWWEGVDLNPLDKEGTIGKIFSPPPYSYETLDTAARKALAAKGKNIDNYRIYLPLPGEKLPPDSWKVTYKGTVYTYIPKNSKPIFSI